MAKITRRKVYKFYYIYKTTNLVNGKIYIGQRACNRYPSEDTFYLGSGTYFKAAVEKHGKENFIKEILMLCTPERIDDLEVFWISFYKSTNKSIGYNLANGGGGTRGYKFTDIARQNCSIGQRGKKMTAGAVERSRISRTGAKRSEESRRRMSESQKGKKLPEEVKAKLRGRVPVNKGKKPSEETCLKMSLAKKGKPSPKRGLKMTLEQREKLSNAHKGKPSPMKGRSASLVAIEINRNAHVEYIYTVQTPDGKLLTMTSPNEFCKNHNLCRPPLMKTLRGYDDKGNKATQHKGYKIISKAPINRIAS